MNCEGLARGEMKVTVPAVPVLLGVAEPGPAPTISLLNGDTWPPRFALRYLGYASDTRPLFLTYVSDLLTYRVFREWLQNE